MSRAELAELLLITLATGLAAAALPLHTGFLGWSWDALNHHVYLGMIAESPRWHLDVLAASFQSYQYPYLYWPIYRISQLSGNGAAVAASWAAFQVVMLLVPLWFICRQLFRQAASVWQARAERLAGCVLGLGSVAIWTSLETTANDPLAAVPMLWAVALALSPLVTTRRLVLASLLFGVAVAFKLSNALFFAWMIPWWLDRAKPFLHVPRAAAMVAGSAAGFVLAYAPWGLQLWQHMGHPLYPYFTA